MSQIKRILPIITILIGALRLLQQSFFTLKIPLSVYTPLVGILGIILASRLPKGTTKIILLVANSLIALIFPLYLILVFLFPDLFV